MKESEVKEIAVRKDASSIPLTSPAFSPGALTPGMGTVVHDYLG